MYLLSSFSHEKGQHYYHHFIDNQISSVGEGVSGLVQIRTRSSLEDRLEPKVSLDCLIILIILNFSFSVSSCALVIRNPYHLLLQTSHTKKGTSKKNKHPILLLEKLRVTGKPEGKGPRES